MFNKCLVSKAPHYVEVPVMDLMDDTSVSLMKLPMLDVHEVLAYVHDGAKLRSPEAHVNFYWSWGKRFGAGWARLYADETKYGGPFSDHKVLGVFLNLVLHRPASIRYSRFCIFAVRSELLLGNRTLYPIFRRIVWGFHLAFKGVHADGRKLCSDGARFLCSELRGDLAWHKCIWQFDKLGWQSKNICWFCDARADGEPLYTDTGSSASWVQTMHTDTWEWAEKTLPSDALCPLLALPGFQIETLRLCSMHNLNLGLLQTANGSALTLWLCKYTISSYLVFLKRSEACMHGGCMCLCEINIRISLVNAGLYGDPKESVSLNLKRAFRDFESWRKSNRIQCTQGVWTPGLVARLVCGI